MSTHDARNAAQVAVLREALARAAHYCPGCTEPQAGPGLCTRCRKTAEARSGRRCQRVTGEKRDALIQASALKSRLPAAHLRRALNRSGELGLADGRVLIRDGASYYVIEHPHAPAPTLIGERFCIEVAGHKSQHVRAITPEDLAEQLLQVYEAHVTSVPLLPVVALSFATSCWHGAQVYFNTVTVQPDHVSARADAVLNPGDEATLAGLTR